MPALSITAPYPIFTESDGQPLENGYIWIGAANSDPRTSPITVYSDRLLTIPVSQPMRTLNGYFLVNGSPSELFVNATNYSILVQNRFGAIVFSKLAGLNEDRIFSSVTVSGNLGVSGSTTLQSVSGTSATFTSTNSGSLTASSAQINGNQTVTGNVGIGTNAPATKLHIVGQLRASGSVGSGYALFEYGASSTATNNWHAGSEGDGSFRFYNGELGSGLERFRIESSGVVKSLTSGGGKIMEQASIRAWAKFNMSGAAGNQSFTGMGVSSVVKNADNSLTINFSDPMPDANYAIIQGPGIYAASNGMFMDSTPVFGTTSFRINCVNAAGTVVAPNFVSFAVVR